MSNELLLHLGMKHLMIRLLQIVRHGIDEPRQDQVVVVDHYMCVHRTMHIVSLYNLLIILGVYKVQTLLLYVGD